MGSTTYLVLFILQLLAFKDVYCYPANDYILAYIPIEEFAYLASTSMEVIPITSYEVVYPASVEIGTVIIIDEWIYCNGGQSNCRCSCPSYVNNGYSVYSPASLTVYRPPKVPTVNMLPSVSVPTPTTSTGPVLFPTVPTESYQVYEPVNDNQYSCMPTPCIPSPPTMTGTMGFRGMVPAAGSVKIYAKYC